MKNLYGRCHLLSIRFHFPYPLHLRLLVPLFLILFTMIAFRQVRPILIKAISLQVKNYEEAIRYFNTALRINSRNSTTYNSLGVSLLNLGKAEKALDCYQKALDINPDEADTHCNLGSLFIQEGEYEKAVSHFTEVLRIKPNDGAIHFTLGMLYLI